MRQIRRLGGARGGERLCARLATCTRWRWSGIGLLSIFRYIPKRNQANCSLVWMRSVGEDSREPNRHPRALQAIVVAATSPPSSTLDDGDIVAYRCDVAAGGVSLVGATCIYVEEAAPARVKP